MVYMQRDEAASGPASFDALATLREAGHPIDMLSEDQQDVFARLDRAEVEFLNSIKRELEAATGDVEGQDMKIL